LLGDLASRSKEILAEPREPIRLSCSSKANGHQMNELKMSMQQRLNAMLALLCACAADEWGYLSFACVQLASPSKGSKHARNSWLIGFALSLLPSDLGHQNVYSRESKTLRPHVCRPAFCSTSQSGILLSG
jgi:hypothetical protein